MVGGTVSWADAPRLCKKVAECKDNSQLASLLHHGSCCASLVVGSLIEVMLYRGAEELAGLSSSSGLSFCSDFLQC